MSFPTGSNAASGTPRASARPGRPRSRLGELATTTFPKLVISGEHSPVFEALCDRLAGAIVAERAHLPGRGHTIPAVGEAYNSLVDEFLRRAEASAT